MKIIYIILVSCVFLLSKSLLAQEKDPKCSAAVPSAKRDSRWNLGVPRGGTCGIEATDHRVRTTEPESENLNNENADNEEPLSSPRD